MAFPLILGLPLIPVAINAAAGVLGTVVATRLLAPKNDASGSSANPSWKFWVDGIDAKEGAMIGFVGLAAFGTAVVVSRARS